MKNPLVADIFNSIADILELKGENPFRVRAYKNAARTIEGLPKDVGEMSGDEILKIKGIGSDLEGKIEEIVRTGRLEFLDELIKSIPKGLTELLSVPGLGPKTAKLFYDKFKISSVDELERLAKEHRLAGLPGIKEKTEENILRGIESFRRHSERQPLGLALPAAEGIINHLTKSAPVVEISLAGSIRRRKDTVKDIDILCTSRDPDKVMQVFTGLPFVSDLLAHGPTKSSVIIEDGIQVDLRVVDEESYGAALNYFTGSKAHNIRLREMALKLGLKVNEYGIFKGNKKIGGQKEKDLYDILELPFIPPELREDSGEVEAALSGDLPKVIELEDILGDLHVHTNRSDGKHTPEELVTAARDRGYKYIAVTDHSKGLGIAGGLKEDELMEQIGEIDAINKKLRGFKILKGIEVDIRSDLTLDFDDDILKRLDIVVASIHSGFRQSREKLTARIAAAMKNPHVHIIAHPTGRLIGERDAYDVDITEVLKIAKETGTALEINAYPMRLDLNDVHCRAAKEMSVPIVISTDTHIIYHFDYMSYGVSTARRGWLEKGDVLNTLDYKSLMKVLQSKKGH
jgi:DNA polymerase (family 10)